MGKAIVVTSGKGGTGKTTVTAGVASCLSVLGADVIVVDADIGLRNLDILLGMNDRVVYDFNDILCGRCTVGDALYQHGQLRRLSLLASPASVQPCEIDRQAFIGMIDVLKRHCDFCLIDSAAGLDTAFDLAVTPADAAIVVVNTERVSLRDAARVVQILDERGLRDIKMIANRVRPYLVAQKDAANIDEAMDATGLPLLGIVPEDETVIACANHASPIVLQGLTEAGRAFLNIARRLMGEEVPVNMKIRVSPSKFTFTDTTAESSTAH